MSGIKRKPGTFCWAELTTSDAAGAKKFYTELMGWETHDDPIPGGGIYTMIRHDGGNAGALYEMTAEMKSGGVPPMWMPYVTVADVAASAKRAAELGGTICKDAFDVFTIGSMAVLKDPTGAAISLWQPKEHHGFDHDDARPGTVCWNELMTNDAGQARDFYTGLFGWTAESQDKSPMPYTMFTNGEAPAAGMIELAAGVPPQWMVYFSVDDCDAKIARATELGAQLRFPAMDIPEIGRFACLSDPQGAGFAMIKLKR